MCLLIVLRGLDEHFPVIVASNRDEDRERPASPPGLTLGDSRRILSPKDKRSGGTWMGINDRGMFAGLTNVVGVRGGAAALSRGLLPHLALDQDGVAAACDAVEAKVRQSEQGETRFAGFQLVVADALQIQCVRLGRDGIERGVWAGTTLVVTNEHRPGELNLPGLPAALAGAASTHALLDQLAPLLLDTGAVSGHPVLKVGNPRHCTVSSGLLALPHGAPDGNLRELVWRYAPGAPDETAYRNYGNLGRRLIDGA